jgi:hypothetical protein
VKLNLHPLIVVGLVLAAGCGYSPDLPPVAPVTGKVFLDGNPLPRGMVQFVPEGGGAPATAPISSDGTYELKTATVKGAVIGTHQIGVVSQEEPKDETDTYPASLIPTTYNNPTASGLTYTVVEGPNNHDIQLKSK